MSTMFRPQTTEELKARRDELLSNLAPTTIRDLIDLRSIDMLSLEQEEILEEFFSLQFVIGED